MHDCVAYKQEQRGRKEAAADRKKKVQLSSISSEPLKTATDVAMDSALPLPAAEDQPNMAVMLQPST